MQHGGTDDGRQAQAGVFAANRAVGSIRLATQLVNGRTRRRDVYEAGSLRVRFPNSGAEAGLTGVLVNTAGGVAGGDRFDISIDAPAGTRQTITTAAAEKIYRSHGPDSVLQVSLSVGPDAHLGWLPQETILFDQARMSRRIDIDMAETSSLLVAEIIVFGRAAMNERMTDGSISDRWRLRRGGRLVFAETVRLDGGVHAKLMRPAIARGGAAVATILMSPGDESAVERLRNAPDAFTGEVGVSYWNGFLVARFCAAEAARVRDDVIVALARLDPAALPRLWLN